MTLLSKTPKRKSFKTLGLWLTQPARRRCSIGGIHEAGPGDIPPGSIPALLLYRCRITTHIALQRCCWSMVKATVPSSIAR